MTRWADRLSRILALVLLALLSLRLLQAVFAHSLWLDEWATLEGAFAPTSWVERLYTLSGPASVNFPTFYLVTRTIGQVIAFAGQPVETLVRLPATLLTVLALALAARWAFPVGRLATGPWIAAALPGILLTTGDWTQHAGEGRVYGLMSALAVAMVLAAARGRIGPACACGLALAALHPFGTLLGFAPALAVLAGARLGLGERMGIDRRQVRRTAWSAGAVLVLVALWIQVKYVGHQTGGYGLRHRGGDMAVVLSGLDLHAAIPFALVTLAGVVVLVVLLRQRSPQAAALPGAFAALTGAGLCFTLGLGTAALALVRPGVNVAMPRYVAWVVPALQVGAAAGIGLFLDALARRWLAERSPRLLAGLAVVGAILAGTWSLHLLRTVALGPHWADGLHEAARYLDHAAGPQTAVATDFREIFRLFPPYDEGYPCPRSPQIVPYLSPEVRAQVACQDAAGRVVFGAEVREVLLVREPIPVTEGRTVVLDDFRKTEEIRFANTTVERYRRPP